MDHHQQHPTGHGIKIKSGFDDKVIDSITRFGVENNEVTSDIKTRINEKSCHGNN